jgi:hypothetical protein
MGYQPTLSSLACSIWDAEETCDAFAFKKNPVLCQEDPTLSRVTSPGACKQTARTCLEGTGCSVEVLFASFYNQAILLYGSMNSENRCNIYGISCRSYLK